jgi:hypothetical protein
MDQKPSPQKNGTRYNGEPHASTAPIPDLAEHFLECGKIGRYLTVVDESRFVVSDDFREGIKLSSVATAAASVFSRDALVAQAALVPLGLFASTKQRKTTERYEELFTIIEQTAFSTEVRDSAEAIVRAGFQEARIREIERELGSRMSPARDRYRVFLEVVRSLMEKRISVAGFREEFLAFTQAVAGKLDFGIFSFCLDRIFINPQIPINAKGSLIAEVMLFPDMIRREIITNVLSHPEHNGEFTDFVRTIIEQELDNETVIQIYLLVTLKTSRLSISAVEDMFLKSPAA